MSHIRIPQDAHIVTPPSGLLNRAWHSFLRSLSNRVGDIGHVTEVTTVDASDLATAITLVNELKDKVNAITAAAREE